jgi:uncharacterized membrane protein YeaQ/YmgE (transglycosylase-associated protein family)
MRNAGMFETHGIIVSLIIGFVIGAIAKFLMPGKDPGGCLVTIILGLVGSFIGGVIGQSLFGSQYIAGWIASILGAMLLLFLYRLVLGKRK